MGPRIWVLAGLIFVTLKALEVARDSSHLALAPSAVGRDQAAAAGVSRGE